METKSKPEPKGSSVLTEGLRPAPIFSFDSQARTIANKMLGAHKTMDFNVHRPSHKLKADIRKNVVDEMVNYLEDTLKQEGKALKPEFHQKLRDIYKSIGATDPSVQQLSSEVLKSLNECVVSAPF
ncbi:MAG: hypothetical protein KGH71_04305 [Candidatus Micrarchaeota archaeon]|nr:hypothetical protein [Candidatus Micrarchaeota archaeon]